MATSSSEFKTLTPVHHGIASQGAAAVSTLFFYPLDTLKMRYMSQDGTSLRVHNGGKYKGIVPSLRLIVAEEGSSALYRGAPLAVCAAAISWGLYMGLYRQLENSLVGLSQKFYSASMLDSNQHENLFTSRTFTAFAASVAAGGAATLVTSPLWMVKARMQLEDVRHTYEAALPASGKTQIPTSTVAPTRYYTNAFTSLKRVVSQDGVLSLWRGVSAQLLLGVPLSLYFPVYDTFKKQWRRYMATSSPDSPLRCYETWFLSGTAKMLVALFSHPLLLIRARLQDEKARASTNVRYTSVAGAFRVTFAREGLTGLWRGFGVGLAHSLPRTCLQVSLYEAALQLVNTSRN